MKVPRDTARAAGATGPAQAVGNDPARDAATAAAAQLARGEPENVARAAEAASGSALDAPSVGAGPAGREGQVEAAAANLAGVAAAAIGAVGDTRAVPAGTAEPGLYDTLGAHGARTVGSVPELAAGRRLAGLTTGDARRYAAPFPADRAVLGAYVDAGYDLVVTSRQDGRRRAGDIHPAAPTLRRSRDFTLHELEQLTSDPMLIVSGLR